MWADLRFDFGSAPIFYPLQQLYFQNADFASSTIYGPADFFDATFHGDTGFSAAHFTTDASFHGANFNDWVGFSAAHFAGAATFSGAHFAVVASFSTVTFTGERIRLLSNRLKDPPSPTSLYPTDTLEPCTES